MATKLSNELTDAVAFASGDEFIIGRAGKFLRMSFAEMLQAGYTYRWNTSTSAADPTTGKVGADSATLASITALYISETDILGNAIAGRLATWDDGTSTIRGRVVIVDPQTRTNFLDADITGTITDNGTWDTFSLTPRASGGDFSAAPIVSVFFVPKGDKGDTGTAGAVWFTGSIDPDNGDGVNGDFYLQTGTGATGVLGDVWEKAAGSWSIISNIRGATGGGLAAVVDDTTPQLGGMLDVNGQALGDGTLEILKFSETASAINEITIANAAVGAGPTISATGDDTNIDLNLVPKGTGGVQLADAPLKRPTLIDYGETVNAIGSTGGGTQDIDLTLGNVVSATVDTSANTFTFSNPSASGKACSFTLILTNGGSQTVNWPASVNWAGGAAPTLTTSGVDVLSFVTIDGGTTWYGFAAGLAMA